MVLLAEHTGVRIGPNILVALFIPSEASPQTNPLRATLVGLRRSFTGGLMKK
jgi:hypothetical protein